MRSFLAHSRRALAALAVLAAGAAWSAPYVCPDGERFGARPDPRGVPACGGVYDSYRQRHSDAEPRPYGDVTAQWPTCPRSGFVMFRDTFSREEARRLRAYMKTGEYRALRDDESPHFQRAMTLQVIDGPNLEVFFALADAARDSSWPRHARRWRHYAEVLVGAADALLGRPGLSAHEQASIQYLALAWERRLGRFDAAKARLDRVSAPPGLTDYELMLGHQAAWIAARDSAPHWVRPEQIEFRMVRGAARADGIALPKAAL